MTAPSQLYQLVEHFDNNLSTYKAGRYNETQVRREFIDPLFKLLGWDVENEKGQPETFKEVIHEDSIKVAGGTRAPDYCFRIDGHRKFFVEAKKPSVNLEKDTHPAYQLRRYGWSAKLPLSILNDFEEFSVYDCRVQPAQSDQATTARIQYLTYKEYIGQWDFLVNTFSPDAVHSGAFDRYVETNKVKKGTAEVDSVFLQEIERWRDSLARNLALRNSLSQRQLNFAVQRIIDRIIFLRIAEDRGLEPYGQLQDLLHLPNIYARLTDLFRRADDRYNSGLFHFNVEKNRQEEADRLTPHLVVDDKILKDIIKNIYYPVSPYEFSVFSADILGQVYEQFLGKVIRLTSSHRAIIEDKPEVKKAGGVFYTPTYIVEYIVGQTVGKLVEGKTPGQVEGLKLIDPACGSGSFVLGAYQYLLDWYRDRYIEDNPAKWAKGGKGTPPRLYRTQRGDWKLTIAERKRILLDHIHGVDIDPQAVEVTKLSLLLKVLEDATGIVPQLELIQHRVLPDLGDNIKCGNSLIGPDFYNGQQLALFDEEEMYRVNAFDWQAEFPAIMRGGNYSTGSGRGFDAVIGNPPYLFITEQRQSEKDYFRGYTTYSYRYDVYGLFIEQAFRQILCKGGRFGFIIPHTLLNNDSFEALRRFLLDRTSLDSIIDLGPGVFQTAKNETMLIFALNSPASEKHQCRVVKSSKSLDNLNTARPVPQKWFGELPKTAFLVTTNPASIRLLEKLRSCQASLGDYCTINQGLRTGNNERFLSLTKELSSHRPAVGGKNIARYSIRDHFFVQYEPDKLDAPRKEYIFTSPEKLIVQEVRNITLPRRIIAAYDDQQFFSLQTTNVLNLKGDTRVRLGLKYLLGLLNSCLLNWFFRTSFPSNNHIASNQLAQLPIHLVDFSNPTDKAQHDQMVNLVEQILNLHQRLAGETVPQTRTVLQRQIEATDRQIDQLVYELYGLSEDEIEIVEGRG